MEKTIGTKREVFKGVAKHTTGGLVKKDIAKKNGKYVSKKKLKMAKSNKGLQSWRDAVAKARKELGVTGFMPIKKGTELYKLAKRFHNGEKVSGKKSKKVKKANKKQSVVDMFKSMFSKK